MIMNSVMDAKFTKKEYLAQDEDFRIGAVISDGMWYSASKWRKIAKVSEEKINEWISKHLADGSLVQSSTGAKSYRFPLSSIEDWYEEHGFTIGEQIVEFLFPARVWDGVTEAEGFLDSPLREVGIVTFECDPSIAPKIIASLRGHARVREFMPNIYKAYGLDSVTIKNKVNEIFSKYRLPCKIMYSKCQKDALGDSVIVLKCASNVFAEIEHELTVSQIEFSSKVLKPGDDNKSGTFLIALSDVDAYDPVLKGIEKLFEKYEPRLVGKLYARPAAKRRELVDFTTAFSEGLVDFYRVFAKSLVKSHMETIKIFLPDSDDQETQMVIWVIDAIEKFDESASVPFSGYLNAVLNRWPYDLPNHHLGGELSKFQSDKAKIVKQLSKRGDRVTNDEIAAIMEMDRFQFDDLNAKDRFWKASRAAADLVWEDTFEEKDAAHPVYHPEDGVANQKDVAMLNKISQSVIISAIESEKYDDAFLVIGQMDTDDLNFSSFRGLSEEFIQQLGSELSL